MSKSTILSTTLLAAALPPLAGCGGSDDVFTGGAGGGTNALSNQSGDLEMTIAADKTAYSRGEPVALTFTVQNVGVQAVRLDFNTGQQYDFEAHDPQSLRWNWAHGRNFTRELTSLTLQPGETWVRSTTWTQADNDGRLVPPGSYRLKARLTTGGLYRTQDLPIQIR